MRNGIAAVLIVKDEEKVLDRCLRSLEGVDQLVVVDTGSSDRTRELAWTFTSHVYMPRVPVPFHFGDARNTALTHARQDWVITIDADEVMLDGSLEALRKAIRRYPAATGFNVRFILYDEEGKDPTEIRKMKVFRRGLWTWEGRVHERPVPTSGNPIVKELPEIVLEHRPAADKAARRKQNLELLSMVVEEKPDDVQMARQFGMELFKKEEWVRAMEQFKRYLDSDPADRLEKSDVLVHVARCHSNMGRRQEAMRWFDQAASMAPERREPHFYKGVVLVKARLLDDAIDAFEACLAVPASGKPDFYLNEGDIWSGEKPREGIDFCRAQIAEAMTKFEARRKS